MVTCVHEVARYTKIYIRHNVLISRKLPSVLEVVDIAIFTAVYILDNRCFMHIQKWWANFQAFISTYFNEFYGEYHSSDFFGTSGF
jgi:hypothetical protein